MSRTRAHPGVTAGAAVWVVILLVGTVGLEGDPTATPSGWCLICGTRGTADAVVNVLMFVPLGIAAALQGWRRRMGALFILPVLIEVTQRTLPGRHSNLGDVAFNALGIVAGVALVSLLRWSHGSHPRWGAAFWTLSVNLLLLGLGALQLPHLPASRYFANWNPDLRTVWPYPGPVRSATLAGQHLPSGPIEGSARVRSRLAQGGAIEISFLPATSGRGDATLGIFGLWDEHRREVLLLGTRGDRVVVRSWTLGQHFRLSHWDPAITAPGFPGDPGEETRVLLSWDPTLGACLGTGEGTVCQAQLSSADLWTLLFAPPSGRLRPWLSAGFLACILFLLGSLRGPGAAVLAGTLTGVLLVAGPVVLPLAPVPMGAWGGGLLGFAFGRLADRGDRQVFRRRNASGRNQG